MSEKIIAKVVDRAQAAIDPAEGTSPYFRRVVFESIGTIKAQLEAREQGRYLVTTADRQVVLSTGGVVVGQHQDEGFAGCEYVVQLLTDLDACGTRGGVVAAGAGPAQHGMARPRQMAGHGGSHDAQADESQRHGWLQSRTGRPSCRRPALRGSASCAQDQCIPHQQQDTQRQRDE